MVVGAFPAVKLGVLLFKQISKPLANFAKERAKNNRFFRTYVCMPPAQFYNWCEIKSKMWIMNLGAPVNIPVLNEQMAIELGANLLGEGIIFILGAGLLILEYNRSANKEAAKEEERRQEMDHLVTTVKELYFTTQAQETQIHELKRTLLDLESRAVVKPWVLKKEKSDSEEPPPPPGAVPSSQGVTIEHADASSQKDPNRNQINTPYPQGGIVMQSLNYVELDVLNTPQPKVIDSNKREWKVGYDRKSNLIMDALSYLERDVKGLL